MNRRDTLKLGASSLALLADLPLAEASAQYIFETGSERVDEGVYIKTINACINQIATELDAT